MKTKKKYYPISAEVKKKLKFNDYFRKKICVLSLFALVPTPNKYCPVPNNKCLEFTRIRKSLNSNKLKNLFISKVVSWDSCWYQVTMNTKL